MGREPPVERRAARGQLQPVTVAAEISMKRTFRIAPIHRASAGTIRALFRVGTRVSAVSLGPLAPRMRSRRLNWRTGLIRSHHGSGPGVTEPGYIAKPVRPSESPSLKEVVRDSIDIAPYDAQRLPSEQLNIR
jgi:hypothetical protein